MREVREENSDLIHNHEKIHEIHLIKDVQETHMNKT